MATPGTNLLGSFLRERRARLDPATLGLPLSRRRTPGLRREEVAQLAHVSATWYTWLEQGRGGHASAATLERIAIALQLDSDEREHLFLLARDHPGQMRDTPTWQITPRLRAVLDALVDSPAYIKTPTWDVLAWNAAARQVLTDYGLLPESKRNILKIIFSQQVQAEHLEQWERTARFAVATFRSEITRAGASVQARAQQLIDELSETDPRFLEFWGDLDVRSHGEGTKVLHKTDRPTISLNYSSFEVDGQPGLSLVIYTAASPEDAAVITALLRAPEDIAS